MCMLVSLCHATPRHATLPTIGDVVEAGHGVCYKDRWPRELIWGLPLLTAAVCTPTLLVLPCARATSGTPHMVKALGTTQEWRALHCRQHRFFRNQRHQFSPWLASERLRYRSAAGVPRFSTNKEGCRKMQLSLHCRQPCRATAITLPRCQSCFFAASTLHRRQNQPCFVTTTCPLSLLHQCGSADMRVDHLVGVADARTTRGV